MVRKKFMAGSLGGKLRAANSGANTSVRAAAYLRYLAAGADQLHLAPCMPPLIQSSDLTPGGGLTHSAGKYWMSTRSTRLRSGLYLVRAKPIDWIAWWPSASFIWINPPGEGHSSPVIAATSSSVDGFLPPFLAIAFSTAAFNPRIDCVMR